MPRARKDYDSPWKVAVERHFPELMQFFFPESYSRIDWSKEYIFLDKELQAVVKDAKLGRRYVDKLVRVTLLTGEEDWIYIHIEVQGKRERKFGERMFVYNYRLFDRYRRTIVTLAILADDSANWRPDGFAYEGLGCRMSLRFPVAKLLDYAGREAELLTQSNTFALVTAAHLMSHATRHDMAARLDAKWTLIRSLYRRGWDRQRIVDLFAILDWMMWLPETLECDLWRNIETLEEEKKMRYMTNVERFIIRREREEALLDGLEQGMQRGEVVGLIRILEKRFGLLGPDRRELILSASKGQVEIWYDRLLDAPSLDSVLTTDSVH